MTDSKKSGGTASEFKFKRSEARKNNNLYNVILDQKKTRSKPNMYGGMLFPSRVVCAEHELNAGPELK